MRRLAGALVLASAIAHANGRPPLTNGVFFQPNDPHSLFVRTTFGLLISHDDGCTFDWICEQNIGYGGSFDPKYSIATDGTIYATTFSGLRVSHDGGCSFTTVAGGLPAVWLDALDIGPGGEIWAGTTESGAPNNVFSSNDGGATWHAKGMLSSTIWWKSVKVAPSDAKRIYLSGYEIAGASDAGMTPKAHLFESENDGTTWTESALPGVMYGSTPVLLVAAVDPSNADILYVISVGANPQTGDRLYRSTDKGATLTEVLATTDLITGVVIKDAQTVLVSTQVGGSFVSTTGGTGFASMTSPPQLECLGKSPNGLLYGCGANWQPDYMSVAKSTDASSWQKVWRFVELAGPLKCPAGTAEHDTCDQMMWATLQQQFGATGPTCGANVVDGAPPDGANGPGPKKSGCCDAGSGPPVIAALFVVLVLMGQRRLRHDG